MPYEENELLPLSGLQHLVFCKRQWALIHLEGQWVENRLTAQGRVMHERSHDSAVEVRGDVRIVRGLRLCSLELGLTGQADVVEFHRDRDANAGAAQPPLAAPLPGLPGRWRPFPIEYKRGMPKHGACDEVQLCAQAMCLEEMLAVYVPAGALFYGKTHRRHEVAFSPTLRDTTAALAAAMHRAFTDGITPRAPLEPKCRQCSLLQACMPRSTAAGGRVQAYISRQLNRADTMPEEKDEP